MGCGETFYRKGEVLATPYICLFDQNELLNQTALTVTSGWHTPALKRAAMKRAALKRAALKRAAQGTSNTMHLKESVPDVEH